MSSFANAPQNQTFSFGPPTTTTQNQPGNYTTIVNQRMGGGLGGYGSMGGYGGATGAPFNLSAANPMGAGLGGFGGFGGMGGYGFNPMMGGGFGGFGGMGGYGFNPMMGGGFGGFGYNPMMGGGFGGFGGMGGFGYNPMMGMGLGSFGGFGGMGGFNPMMGGGFGTPFNPMPQQPPPGFEFNPDYRPRNVGPGMATTMDMRPSDEMFRPIQQPQPGLGLGGMDMGGLGSMLPKDDPMYGMPSAPPSMPVMEAGRDPAQDFMRYQQESQDWQRRTGMTPDQWYAKRDEAIKWRNEQAAKTPSAASPPAQAAMQQIDDATISDETGQYDPNRGRQTEQLIQPISAQAQAQMQLLDLLRQQQLLGGFNPIAGGPLQNLGHSPQSMMFRNQYIG